MSSSTVFTNNRSQAIRLPADARLPPHLKRVEVRVRGAERIIVPSGTGGTASSPTTRRG
jgi:antitoxin VapB